MADGGVDVEVEAAVRGEQAVGQAQARLEHAQEAGEAAGPAVVVGVGLQLAVVALARALRLGQAQGGATHPQPLRQQHGAEGELGGEKSGSHVLSVVQTR